jgi:hypothetical protein
VSRDRLGVVARLRRYTERQMQSELAEAQLRLKEARLRLDVLRQPSYAGERAELTTAHLIALRAQGIVCAEDLAVAREEWAKREHQVLEAVTALKNATSKRKASDELMEKRRLANAAAAATAAQKALDEIVLMRRERRTEV